MQLGPNAFHALDALGVGELARSRAVFTDFMVMHDALDGSQVGHCATAETFRTRCGNPLAVIPRCVRHFSWAAGG